METNEQRARTIIERNHLTITLTLVATEETEPYRVWRYQYKRYEDIWQALISNGENEVEAKLRMPSGITPEPWQALDSLATDARAYADNSFEEFATLQGFYLDGDEDEARQAQEEFQACEETYHQLRELLGGNEFLALLYGDEEVYKWGMTPPVA